MSSSNPRLPRAVNPPAGRASTAPYNFVPLPDEVWTPGTDEPDRSRLDAGRHSGHLAVEIVTESPLYIRAGVPPADASEDLSSAVWKADSPHREHHHHGDPAEPVIPGSSVRGMIRELVEIVSDSALRTAPSRPIVYRSVGDTTRFGWFYRRRFVGKNLEGDPDSTSLPQTLAYPIADVRGGYLFKEGRDWFIQPAARHHGESFTRCDERHVPRAFTTVNRHFAAWVKPAARTPHRHHDGKLTLIDPRTEASVQGRDGENAAPGGMVPGWLVRTDGVGNRKHMHLVVHAPDDEAKPIPIPRGIKQAYEDDASMQRDPNRPGRFPPRPGTQGPPEPPAVRPLAATVNADAVWPCFYLVERLQDQESVVFFGGTLFFRLPYLQPPSLFAGVQPVTDLDLARQLFGTVGRERGVTKVRKGRLRFEDFRWLRAEGEPDPFLDGPDAGGYGVPRQLLQPKPACIQHYLVQENPRQEGIRHYDDNPAGPGRPSGTVLRGFKRYWHRLEADRLEATSRYQHQGERKTRTVIRPIRPGLAFEGRIRFESLSDEELGALLVAIELRPDQVAESDGEPQHGLRHSLGMGKKLGFGSVRLSVRAIHLIDPKLRHRSFFSEGEAPTGPSATVLEPGWHPAEETKQRRERALLGFCRAIGTHRGEGLARTGDPSLAEAMAALWSTHRMKALAALLDRSHPPPPERVVEVGVAAGGSEQWRRRFLLPPAEDVHQGRSGRPVDDRHRDGRRATSGPDRDRRPLATTVPVAPAPLPPPPLEPATWEAADVLHVKGGGGELLATRGGQKAVARGAPAIEALLATLPEDLAARVRAGKKSVRLSVEVTPLGRAYAIAALRPAKG